MAEKRRYKDLKKPDQFIVTINRIINWLRIYQRPVSILSIAIVTIILVSGIIYHVSFAMDVKTTKDLFNVLLYDNAPVKTEQKEEEKQLSKKIKKLLLKTIEFNSDEEKIKKSIKEYKKVLEKHGEDSYLGVISLISLGRNYYRLGKYKEALDYYKKAEKFSDKTEEVKFLAIEGLGLCYEALNKLESAKAQFEKLEKLGKEYRLLAWYHLGRIYYEQKNNKKAIKYLKKVLEEKGAEDNFYVYNQAKELLLSIAPSEVKPEPLSQQFLESLSNISSKGKK